MFLPSVKAGMAVLLGLAMSASVAIAIRPTMDMRRMSEMNLEALPHGLKQMTGRFRLPSASEGA